MESTKQGRDYPEDAAVAAAIAAVAEASEADAKADAGTDARADAGADTEANAEAIDAAIFDFAESIELDHEDVAKEVDEAGDGNVNVGGDINDGDDQGDGDGDGDGGGLAWERVTKKRKSEMRGDDMYIHFDWWRCLRTTARMCRTSFNRMNCMPSRVPRCGRK